MQGTDLSCKDPVFLKIFNGSGDLNDPIDGKRFERSFDITQIKPWVRFWAELLTYILLNNYWSNTIDFSRALLTLCC